MKYQVHRQADGWHLYSRVLSVESMYHAYATRRQALTALQMMLCEMDANGIVFAALDDEDEARA